MPKISLCMIVKNEEKFLAECLESVKNIVDEIIIVDTGSTDKTIEIANSYNARVFHFEWKNDFSQARNESIKYATGDWILILDADERLNPGQETKIKKYLNLNFDGLYVRIISADKNGELYVTEYPRLFRKMEGIKFERKIHEQISPSILKLGGKLAKTDITITHLGYGQDDETMRKKYERNLQILLEELEENPNDAYTCYHIGITKTLIGEQEEGLKYLKRAISIPREKSNINDSLRAFIYNIFGNHEFQMGNSSQALDWFTESTKLAPVQISSYYHVGLIYLKDSNFILAKNFFEKALKNLHSILKGKPSDLTIEAFLEPEDIHLKLAMCYFKLGNHHKLNESLLKILPDEKFYETFLNFLVEEYKEGNKNATQVIKHISSLKPSFYVFKILSGIYQIEGDLENAVESLRNALKFKDDDEIRYNLGTCLVGLKRFDESIKVLGDFLNRPNSQFFENALKVLAFSYIALGDFRNALNCYEIMFQLNPGDEIIKSKIYSITQKLANLRLLNPDY